MPPHVTTRWTRADFDRADRLAGNHENDVPKAPLRDILNEPAALPTILLMGGGVLEDGDGWRASEVGASYRDVEPMVESFEDEIRVLVDPLIFYDAKVVGPGHLDSIAKMELVFTNMVMMAAFKVVARTPLGRLALAPALETSSRRSASDPPSDPTEQARSDISGSGSRNSRPSSSTPRKSLNMQDKVGAHRPNICIGHQVVTHHSSSERADDVADLVVYLQLGGSLVATTVIEPGTSRVAPREDIKLAQHHRYCQHLLLETAHLDHAVTILGLHCQYPSRSVSKKHEIPVGMYVNLHYGPGPEGAEFNPWCVPMMEFMADEDQEDGPRSRTYYNLLAKFLAGSVAHNIGIAVRLARLEGGTGQQQVRPYRLGRNVVLDLGFVYKAFVYEWNYDGYRRRPNVNLWKAFSRPVYDGIIWLKSGVAPNAYNDRGDSTAKPQNAILITKWMPQSERVSVGHAISLLETVAAMAEGGVVHMDIRRSNVVFVDRKEVEGLPGLTSDPTEHAAVAYLIDWDFGGLVDEVPAYPPGYNLDIQDGYREHLRAHTDALERGELRGECWHDAMAAAGLIKMIFDGLGGVEEEMDTLLVGLPGKVRQEEVATCCREAAAGLIPFLNVEVDNTVLSGERRRARRTWVPPWHGKV